MKPYTRANLYSEIAKRDRRIRAFERDNRRLREAASKEGIAVIQSAMRACQKGKGFIFGHRAMVHDTDAVMALEDDCGRLAAKRKERRK